MKPNLLAGCALVLSTLSLAACGGSSNTPSTVTTGTTTSSSATTSAATSSLSTGATGGATGNARPQGTSLASLRVCIEKHGARIHEGKLQLPAGVTEEDLAKACGGFFPEKKPTGAVAASKATIERYAACLNHRGANLPASARAKGGIVAACRRQFEAEQKKASSGG